MKETNHPSSLATCTLIQDLLGVTDAGIYEAVVQLKQQLDAVVAECAVVKSLNSKLCDELRGYETDNEDFGPAPQSLALAYSTETHAADAALAEVGAKVIEKFADTIGEMYQHEKPATVRARTIKHIVFLATHYAKELREGRG